MPAPLEITVNQLLRQIGTPNQPVLIDICTNEEFNEDAHLIPGSRRWPFTRITELVPDLQSKKAVVICQNGKKLYQGTAALLRTFGV